MTEATPLLGILIKLAEEQEPETSTPILRDDARALLTMLSDAQRDLGKWKRIAETRAGIDDEGRRKLAEAAQIRVTADHVEHNADKRVRETWRLYQETRALLVAVLVACDAYEKAGAVLSDANARAIRAARDAMGVADLGPPPAKIDTT